MMIGLHPQTLESENEGGSARLDKNLDQRGRVGLLFVAPKW